MRNGRTMVERVQCDVFLSMYELLPDGTAFCIDSMTFYPPRKFTTFRALASIARYKLSTVIHRTWSEAVEQTVTVTFCFRKFNVVV